MSCSKAFFGLMTINSPECGANKVELSSEVYNQLNNFVSNSINSGINVASANVNRLNLEQIPGTKVENCSILQENLGRISVVNNINQSQKVEFVNNIANEVQNNLSQEQQQAILQAFEGEGKSNIADIENDLKNIITNTTEQALNSFINTGTFNENTLNLKIGNWDCNGVPFTQRNISDIQIQNFITTLQDALSRSDVVNTISNSISQKNTSGLADIFKYLIIGGVILGIIIIIGGGIFGFFKLKKDDNITCSQDSDCAKIKGLCTNKRKNSQTGKVQGICTPISSSKK